MSPLSSQPTTVDVARAWTLLDSLTDPEIPVVTLRELGILRDVRAGERTACSVTQKGRCWSLGGRWRKSN